jgi:3-dehydroquinate dehydratase/shikimate dehydrogenase
MGEAGIATRVLALREPCCFLTYAASGQGAATAPGQVSAGDLRSIYGADRLTPDTKVFGLLGPYLDAERVAFYNTRFRERAVDAVAVPFVAGGDAPGIVDAFRALPVAGWHVLGAELQATVGQALDRLDASACSAGQVNAILAEPDGSLRGAWVDSPEEQASLWLGR